MRIYNVGDTVWLAQYDHTEVKMPCPVCFGEKQVILILGNGETVALPCDYCGKRCAEPRGFIMEYEYTAKVQLITITEVQSKVDSMGEERRYYFGGRCTEIQDIWDTKEEALARCAEKVAQQKLEETTSAFRIKANHLQSYAWNAGYHLRQAKEYRKRAEYHEQKAVLCKGKVMKLRGEG